MKRLKEAMNIGGDYEFGAAFDLELQERKRVEKLDEKEKIKKERKHAKKVEKRKKEREMLEMQLKEIKPVDSNLPK